ncbi:MAG: hypothetical protein GY756_16450 [bacterium]|nr:hypothetical protein [bacterium]
MSEFITITKAIELTGKSKSTIRRFVLAHNDNETIIRKEFNPNNRPLYKINKAFLLSYFNVDKTNSGSTENNNLYKSNIDSQETLLIHEKLLNQKKQFRVILISAISVFIIIFIFGFYFYNRVISKLDSELSLYKSYQENNQRNYSASKEDLKNAYKTLLDVKQKEIDDLKAELNEHKQKLTTAEKRMLELENDKQKLINKLPVATKK